LDIEELHEGLDLVQMQSKQLILQGFDFNEQLAEQTSRCQDLQSQVHELNSQLRQREVEIKRSRQQTRDVSEAEQMCARRLEHREAMCEQALAYGAYCEKAYSELRAALPSEMEHMEERAQEREVRCECFLEAAASAAKKLSASCMSEIAELREELRMEQHEYTEECLSYEDALKRLAEVQRGHDIVLNEHVELQSTHVLVVQHNEHLEEVHSNTQEMRSNTLQQNELLQEELSGSVRLVETLRLELAQSQTAESKVALHSKHVEESLLARPSHDLVAQLQSQISAQRVSSEHRVGLLEARLALREAQLGLRAEYNMDQTPLDSYRSHLTERQRSPLRSPAASWGYSSLGFGSPLDIGSRAAQFDVTSPYMLKQRQNLPDMYSAEYRSMYEAPIGQVSEASRYVSPLSPGRESLRPHR